jgi:outer membrane protein OmpA-like peptidoglycan-associated protein
MRLSTRLATLRAAKHAARRTAWRANRPSIPVALERGDGSSSLLLKGGLATLVFLLCSFLGTASSRAQAGVMVETEAPARMSAHPLTLRLEPGMALALTSPQSGRTDAGFGQTIKLGLGLTPSLQIGPSATFTTLPAVEEMDDAGTSWSFGGGLRLMRPHDAAPNRRGFSAASPWLDADALYVRTGDLDRPGFAAGVGLAVPIDARRRLWLGPYVRYFHIVQGDRDGFDNRDAKLLTFGLSLEVGAGLQRQTIRTVAAVAAVEPPVAPAQLSPDRDGDGVSDADDRCPDVMGTVTQAGCPPYEQVVVSPDKIEVKQKIAFEWSSSRLTPESHVALDEVARAMRDNPAFRFEVEGHASSEGEESVNQPLSEQRASAVVQYLVAHGIANDRLASRGFSSSVPISTNATAAGRQSNRRVEFVVHFLIVNSAPQGSTP